MKLPDYDQRSELASTLATEVSKKTFEEVQEIIRNGLSDSAKGLIALTTNSDPTIKLNAIKHHLKLGGLERENIVHSGKVEFEPFIISRGEHG